MNKKWIRKIIRVIGVILMLLMMALAYVIYSFTSPNSDKDIIEKFASEKFQPFISHKNFKGESVRVISMQKKLNPLLPVILFVHGSPGSSMDFKRYMANEELNRVANMISYDRIGYSDINTGKVLNSLEEEVELLHLVMEGIDPANVILAGYSYGGTVIMASKRSFKKKVALAAAVRGDLEPMFWVLNLYKWNLTRPLVPGVLRGASIEKLRHVTELETYEHQWNLSPSKVLSIHGKEDFIVPFQNSLFLKSLFSSEKFSLIPLEEGDHSLIWSNFDTIKSELVKSAKE